MHSVLITGGAGFIGQNLVHAWRAARARPLALRSRLRSDSHRGACGKRAFSRRFFRGTQLLHTGATHSQANSAPAMVITEYNRLADHIVGAILQPYVRDPGPNIPSVAHKTSKRQGTLQTLQTSALG